MTENTTPMKFVEIPACDEHNGYHRATIFIPWVCPVCGGPRGEVERTVSYDGSRRMECDGWQNPCGHVDKYAHVRKEWQALTAPKTTEG